MSSLSLNTFHEFYYMIFSFRMPGVHCCVLGCSNSYYKAKRCKNGSEEVIFSMYCFPKDPHLRKMWIKRCKLSRINPNTARVCYMHFSEDQFEIDMEAKIMGLKRTRRLKSGSVPNRRLGRSVTPERKRILAQGRKFRLERRSLKKDINNLISSTPLSTKIRKTFNEPSNENEVLENIDPQKDNLILEEPIDEESTAVGLGSGENISGQTKIKLDGTEDYSSKECEIFIQVDGNEVEDCLTAVGLVVDDKSSTDLMVTEAYNSNGTNLSNANDKENLSVEAEMERICLSPIRDSVDRNSYKIQSNSKRKADDDDLNSAIKTPCPDCEKFRHENERLKLRLAYFQSKLSQVVEIYHCAEDAARNEVRSEFKKELKRYRNANAELTLNNSHYLNILRVTLPEDEFKSKIAKHTSRTYWTTDEVSKAQRLAAISPEAYLFVKNQMSVSLPEFALLNIDKNGKNSVAVKTENEY